MAAALIAAVPPHLLLRAPRLPSPLPRWWLRSAARSAGLKVRVEGEPLRRRVLFVANHVSWLDIFALGGATGAVFVSRADVAGWPVAGWVAGLHDTIYVERSARREVHGQASQLRAALERGRSVALFPEGTTNDGESLLPFRPSLFASLFPAIPGVRVQPVAIDYGDAATEIAWVGDEPAGDNAKRVLRRKGRLPVHLRFLEPIDPAAAGDRKTVAGEARAAIARALDG
jgi:1-acyl-sn-glycerol-3-phosphate acyltransferase